MLNRKIVSDNYYSEDNASSPIEIRNASSRFSSFFQLNAPFQVTYQFCSGTTAEDYLNTFTLSGGNSYFSHETMIFGKEKEIADSDLYRFIVSDIKSPGRKSYLDFIPAWQNQTNNSTLHNLTEELINTILFPGFGSSYQLKSIICRLLQYLSAPSNYHCTCVELNRDNDFLLFARITHLLEENDGRVSRTELERSLNYSGNYLNRITNKYTGMCLFDYGMTFCFKKAEDYLANTKEPVSDIAVRLGFSNRTHFYTLFKEKYGITPNEYRKEHRVKNNATTDDMP